MKLQYSLCVRSLVLSLPRTFVHPLCPDDDTVRGIIIMRKPTSLTAAPNPGIALMSASSSHAP